MVNVPAVTVTIVNINNSYSLHILGQNAEYGILRIVDEIPSIEDALHLKRLYEEGSTEETFNFISQIRRDKNGTKN